MTELLDVEVLLRDDGWALVKFLRSAGGKVAENILLGRVASAWQAYPAEYAIKALDRLLYELLVEIRYGHTCLTIEACTERFAAPGNPYGKVIVDVFCREALESYEQKCDEYGCNGSSPPWFESFFPEFPQTQSFLDISERLFLDCLATYCSARQREQVSDLMAECWSLMSQEFRKPPYSTRFCAFFELLSPKSVVDTYTLQKLVGVGGMAVVYLAENRDTFPVALKVMRPDCDERERFALEASATVELADPRFVVVKDSNSRRADSSLWFTMNYVQDGKSLSDLIDHPEECKEIIKALCDRFKFGVPSQTGGGWPTFLFGSICGRYRCNTVPRIIASREGCRLLALVIAELAGALHYLHSARGEIHFVHADIKPGNILLSAKNGPLVADLGLCRRLEENGLTSAAPFAGTPTYSPPEQAAGLPLSARSDIFQLGALIYRAIAGKAPFASIFPDEPTERILARARAGIVNPPQREGFTMPRGLQAICLKAMKANPEERYGSAEAMEDDLRRFASGRPVRARSAFWYREFLHRSVRSVTFWLLLATLFVLGNSSWLNSGEIPHLQASQNRYRTRSEAAITKRPLWISDAKWGNPFYGHVRFRESSSLFDLSGWRPVKGDIRNAGRCEPAYYTRVITLQKIPGVIPDGQPFLVSFQFRTAGYGVDLWCSSHKDYKIQGSDGRIKFDDKNEVKVMEITVDLSKEHFNEDITVVINGIIWNGFQEQPDGKQWVAFLSPDELSIGDLAVVFPHGFKPKAVPEASIKDLGDPKSKWLPLNTTGDTCIEDAANTDWFFLHQKNAQPDHIYRLVFDWKPSEHSIHKSAIISR